ncbi:MAG TPA: threonine synthase [Phycisphaerae bacterium]|nr:threonine synthase [Phycisphaerae bacterium]
MPEPIRFYSTNRGVPRVNLAEALLQGQAGDRGLFMPETYPPLTTDDFEGLVGKPYSQVAHAVLRRYTTGIIDDTSLMALCEDAYDYEVPLEHVTGRRHLMRLDRGPTASFKDFAARMMARWMGVLMRQQAGDLVILTATSGDTGSAVAHAYHGVERAHVVVLFPPAEVSDRQRKQMTTIDGNVTTIAVDGKFDDCQAIVKRAFADPDLAAIRLTSANSINIGRLLPQAVYYVYAYVNLADVAGGEPIVICVPSGNFGDMMGAIIAWRMGLPIERLLIATNANDEVPIFLRTGRYQKVVPSRVCISSAMNVGHPSNLARLVDVYGGWMDETGTVREQPDLERMRRDLYAVSVDDDQTRATIKDAYERHGVVLEPHGAVGWAGLEHYWRECVHGAEPLAVSIETAHPAKFPEEIRALIGVDPETPPSLVGLDERPESYETLPAEYEPFRDLLLERFKSP